MKKLFFLVVTALSIAFAGIAHAGYLSDGMYDAYACSAYSVDNDTEGIDVVNDSVMLAVSTLPSHNGSFDKHRHISHSIAAGLVNAYQKPEVGWQCKCLKI